MLNTARRSLLRAWGRWGRAPGWYYQVSERWAPLIANGRSLEATLPNGCRMQCDLRDSIQRAIYFFGAFEPLDSYLFLKLVRPGMTVIDAGANVGQYTLLASQAVGSEGHVYSFEPIPAIFDVLA